MNIYKVSKFKTSVLGKGAKWAHAKKFILKIVVSSKMINAGA